MLLHNCLDYWVAKQPLAEFAAHADRRVTYEQAQATVSRIANAMLASGFRPGDRVAVVSRNSIELVLLCFGAARVGVVTVPVNHQLAASQWAAIAGDAQASGVVAALEFIDGIESVRDMLGSVRKWIALDARIPPHGWTTFDEWLTAAPAATPKVSIEPGDDLLQIYTSGTTGTPKGVVLTHRAVMANIDQINRVLECRPKERSLVVLPMFHAAILPTTMAPLVHGGSIYILPRFDPLKVIEALDSEHISVATLVPTMIRSCVDQASDTAAPHRRLRALYYGASPIDPQLLRQAMKTFACDFIQSYGMTEASQAATFLAPADHRTALQGKEPLLLSAGRPAHGTDIKIVGENGEALPYGKPGEIVIRGPQIMSRYWNRPAETEAVLRDGWLRSGDIGVMDKNGYLYVQDRLKDIIISGGENVSPKLVEDALYRHPAVKEAAVIGVPDNKWGEAVKGLVVLWPGASCTEIELVEHCRHGLSNAERPRSIEFVAALPLSSTGKVLKRVLREPYWEGKPKRVN